MCCSDY